MCGIAGKVSFTKSVIRPIDLKKMSTAIAHRGPDDEGIYVSPNKKLGLVNRRLAIIDLTQAGHQPMVYKGRYWITFNGEIYDYQKVSDKLKKQGYRFKSRSDTEVILALYDKYKEGCLKYLRGMFAFAIYDAKENTLFLARDRIGKKPLKYYWDGSTFIFASELKAILTQPEVKREIDWQAVHSFLTFGYTPAPSTGFININKLKPGHFMLLDLTDKKMTVKRYWRLDFSHQLQLSEKEWSERILEHLTEATRIRMVADVPVGAFLSGGVDSSAVVATMARLSKDPIKTFTIAFKEKKYNESAHAKRLARRYRTDHKELIAQPMSVEELLPKLVYHYEEPYANSSSIVAYMVSELARKHVTVILNGDGGDENFAGYDRYRRIHRDVTLNHINRVARQTLLPLLERGSTNNHKFTRLRKFLKKSRLPLSHRYVTYISQLTNEDKEELYTDQFKHDVGHTNSYDYYQELFEEASVTNDQDRGLYADLHAFLPDDLLAKVDIASMAASLEGRSPLLDHKFIELAAQIPFSLKLKNGEHKYIFKKALETIVPEKNLYRPKMGFSVPLANWFTGNLNNYTRGKLLRKNAKTAQLFKRGVVKKMLDAHSLKKDFGPRLWALLALELWLEEFFD